MKDRLKKKLKSKKIQDKLKTEKRKEYEMPEKYKNNLQLLSEALEMKEFYNKKLSALKGEKKNEFSNLLQKFDKSINNAEESLAKEYERTQEEKRIDEEIEKLLAEAEEASESLYVIIKHEKPHLFEEFHKIATQDMTEDELQAFLDRIAVREANASKTSLSSPIAE